MILLLLLLQGEAPPAPPPPAIHRARHYDITLVPADTGTHLLGEVQTSWTLLSGQTVAALLDSSMRVVRVLVDGRPNTRISRTMYGRSGHDVVVPHQKPPGDSISTRIRYHGLVSGDAWLGEDPAGGWAFVAGGWRGSHSWLPVPPGPPQRVSATIQVQALLGRRAIANGVLAGIDTLPYGHAIWRYRLDSAAPLPALAVAVGSYTAIPLSPRVEVWSRPADSAWAAAGPFRRAGEMEEYYAGILGTLPYPRIVHLPAPALPATQSGGGLALYPEQSFRAGGLDEVEVARATARQWFDGADPALADEMAGYLAAEWAAGKPPKEPARLGRLWAELGEAGFLSGLRAFVRSQREGRGSTEDFAAAMKPGQ